MTEDIEATEDPLRDLNSVKHDDDEEGGAGVDYRRMFKKYNRLPFPLTQ
jgi:hypothetical protein